MSKRVLVKRHAGSDMAFIVDADSHKYVVKRLPSVSDATEWALSQGWTVES